MKTQVSLGRCSSYRRAEVEQALELLLAPAGGMAAFVSPGQRVLLKPNMLAAKDPDLAVTTHPEIVRAVIRMVQKVGGKVAVGDSPGIGSPLQVARRCGILAMIEETGAKFAPFSESVSVRPQGSTFHQLEIARDILDADVIINLPKLKTHQMMGLTCGVKNLFGAVVGMRKPRLHLQAGSDKAFFALMLLELAEHIAPSLTIADAVTAMEGDGPGSGDPIHMGALLASSNPLALDTVACQLAGMRPQEVWTQRVAAASHRPGSQLSQIELCGIPPEELRCRNFRPAKTTDVNFGLPGWLRTPLKQSLSARPQVDRQSCALCGLCVKHCPPEIMTIEKGRLRIDYRRCIGCFCCQELCPHGALQTRQGLLLRLGRFLQRR
ncbi:(4Fe-4S)-binding protein [Syntrophotalea acetylenivorans]|uniref:(4Fe-4S)-binding protein n=1 Tax=Syntrophotalea acetylenivorans TaxID=1842532 RepID=A0A1L3GRS9_9BACT|nr:DUF362 domain-containing protein [Syntrophotalea acetylenivorans]APG28605.1 (4Fe-4S)-binding protein [Syntrophotalea acetylenivorans]